MKMSTKGRYGLRAIVDLAIHSKGELVALKQIADRQNISDAYLEQVFSSLRKAEIVKSFKGSQGGYILGKAPSDITVGEILRTLEGDLFPYEDQEKGSLVEDLLVQEVWKKIACSMNQVIDDITLEMLVIHYKDRYDKGELMFYI